MQAANAILAIDSLDRYISGGPPNFTGTLVGNWTGPTTVLRVSVGQPVKGATVFSTDPGWPAGVTTIVAITGILASGVILAQLSQPTTAASAGIVNIEQTFSYTVASQPISNKLIANFNNELPNCNDFTISSPAALIYGYIDRIIVSQIQLQYNIPTVSLGRNDLFYLAWIAPGGALGNAQVTIPYGFYNPAELAAALQTVITASPAFTPPGITVSYTLEDGFLFQSTTNYKIYVPEPGQLVTSGLTFNQVANIIKTYKLFGLTKLNGIQTPSSSTPIFQYSSHYPNFLYTPYIDIYSDVLTNYQNVKDTNTSVSKPKGLLARVLLSGGGNLQVTTDTTALGSTPFVMTADLNNPKVIKWTPDVAVPSIDFQLRDCYGDLIPGVTEQFPTEFQMTLLCIEG